MTLVHERRRSVAFLEHEDAPWSCFLVTFPDTAGRWKGYFSFRPRDEAAREDEVRTAEIFIERSEALIHEKARGLGRPLLAGLLASAVHARRRERDRRADLCRSVSRALVENARRLSADWAEGREDTPIGTLPADRLRSLYASYRLDQVVHLISLMRPEDFADAVDRILDGEQVDFRASDRIQLSMIVVEHLERLLPLPPYEVWIGDFRDHADAYRLYSHALHREGAEA